MNQEEKATFITNFCNQCRDALLEHVKHMPEEWDGFELRQYVSEEFARQTHLDKHTRHRKRFREYMNTRNVTEGL